MKPDKRLIISPVRHEVIRGIFKGKVYYGVRVEIDRNLAYPESFQKGMMYEMRTLNIFKRSNGLDTSQKTWKKSRLPDFLIEDMPEVYLIGELNGDHVEVYSGLDLENVIKYCASIVNEMREKYIKSNKIMYDWDIKLTQS